MTVPTILYSFRRCPYAMRARLALLLCGLQVALREVDLKDKPEEMLVISPKGTVPVLQLQDGTVIDESVDIVDWAVRNTLVKNGLALAKDQEVEAGLVSMQLLEKFIPLVYRYKYPERYPEVKFEHTCAERNYSANDKSKPHSIQWSECGA